MGTLHVEIVADIVCPWCFIGTRQLEIALESLPTVDADVVYRPFLLDPRAPSEGVDLRETLRRKYGDPEPLFRRVEHAAQAVGLAIDFEKIRRGVSTVRAHTLLRAALPKGTQRSLARAFFDAYFAEGRDVSAFDVLVELGVTHGFEEPEVVALLEDPRELGATRTEAAEAAARGVTGVPFTLIGHQVAVPGAQGADAFRRAVERALGG